ncbi:MAG: transketolase [Deltaproteobacteria bacterium]|nr:transketolase [Deltaproteobacteria bacterium]
MTATSRADTIASLSQRTRAMRGTILEMITAAASGHPGGSLSAIDFIATLFFTRLRHDPKNPTWGDRDRFVLSKGHAVPALYVTLAARGYFDEALLPTLRQLDSPLQGHPVNRFMPACEAPTGSLGQGLSVAQGMALAGRMDRKDYTTYCMMGDGEIQEGQVWEALMSAAKFGLDNLVAIVDWNGGQIDGSIAEVMPSLEPVVQKFTAFGWDVREINGHDFGEILDAIAWSDSRNGKPKCIVARTVKGKGVSFVEHPTKYHGAALTQEELGRALAELKESK